MHVTIMDSISMLYGQDICTVCCNCCMMCVYLLSCLYLLIFPLLVFYVIPAILVSSLYDIPSGLLLGPVVSDTPAVVYGSSHLVDPVRMGLVWVSEGIIEVC